MIKKGWVAVFLVSHHQWYHRHTQTTQKKYIECYTNPPCPESCHDLPMMINCWLWADVDLWDNHTHTRWDVVFNGTYIHTTEHDVVAGLDQSISSSIPNIPPFNQWGRDEARVLQGLQIFPQSFSLLLLRIVFWCVCDCDGLSSFSFFFSFSHVVM